MKHTWHVFGLFSVALAFNPACSSSHSGGGDDDDLPEIDTGEGEGEDPNIDPGGEGEGEGGGCAGACANVVDICDGASEQACLEQCGRFEDNSDGACLAAFDDLNACVSSASACDPDNGVTGCESEGDALDAPCANGCVDIANCFGACAADDQACGEACVSDGDPDGLRALDALVACWTDACGEPPASEADQPAWETCLDGACLDEQNACR